MSDIEFIDIALLKRIDAETTVENFGPKISSTFFEAANLLGALKLKGFVDIHSSIGNSPVIITESGKELLKELDLFSEGNLGRVDIAVLGHIKGGVRDPTQIENLLNINSRDVAYSIYKLWKKKFIDYRIKNGTVEVMLTAHGFEQGPEVQASGGAKHAERPTIEAPPEVRNKIAKELAMQEISLGTETAQITFEQKIIANIKYYFEKYWVYIGIIILLGILVTAVLLAYLK
ncbi:MAG: hypothetical protein ACP5H8_00445 [Candidatus Micrarchaeia archaeon]